MQIANLDYLILFFHTLRSDIRPERVPLSRSTRSVLE